MTSPAGRDRKMGMIPTMAPVDDLYGRLNCVHIQRMVAASIKPVPP